MAEAQANNILQGPWVKNKSSPVIAQPEPHFVTIVEDGVPIVTSGVQLIKHNHIAETLLAIVPILFNNIEIAGFHMEQDKDAVDATVKDGSLIVEAVKSLLCKHYGIYHPLHDVAEKFFEDDDKGGLKIAKSLSMELGHLEPMLCTYVVDDDEDDELEE